MYFNEICKYNVFVISSGVLF